jgi:hypothetical protein
MANKDRPVKLPGSFEEALSDLLKVKPPAKAKKTVPKRKRKAAKKR